MALVAYTDGASSGNPGPSGIGVVLYRNGEKVRDVSEHIGTGTNNVAEYRAVLRALEIAKEMGEKEVTIRTDSQLVVSQLNGMYRTRNPALQALKRRIDALSRELDVRFEHVPREKNHEADKLSKKACFPEKRTGKTVQQRLP